MKFTELINQEFIACVETCLDEHPDGFKEYELLGRLTTQGFFDALDSDIGVSLLLFQKHFLIFHVLHSINQQRIDDKQGALRITTLMIKRLDYVDADTQLGEVDPLAAYYLDMDNLAQATEENVNELLDNFWELYLKYDKRGGALSVLDLQDPVTDKEIVARYRKLASLHHPDKGGEKDKIQAINEAYAILTRGRVAKP